MGGPRWEGLLLALTGVTPVVAAVRRWLAWAEWSEAAHSNVLLLGMAVGPATCLQQAVLNKHLDTVATFRESEHLCTNVFEDSACVTLAITVSSVHVPFLK